MIDLFLLNEINNGIEELNNSKKKKRMKFTLEEDTKLKELVEKLGNKNWQSISDLMPGRNARQCRDRWRNYLSPDVVNGPWTDEEDELLMNKYEKLGPSWKHIAKFFPTRTDINIKSRWNLKQRRIKKEELLKKRINLNKKIGQKNSSNFANIMYQQSLVDNYQKNLQLQKMKTINTNFSSTPINKHVKEKELKNHTSTINSAPLPFISMKPPINEKDGNDINIQATNDMDTSKNDWIDVLLVDFENNDFDNVWF